MEIKLGMKVEDTVSGLTGIATAKSEWLNGCVRYAIQAPVDSDGKVPDDYWVDSGQLEIIGDGVTVEKPKKGPGGPSSSIPQRQSNPKSY